jgi:hypothetical protein
MLKLTVTVLAIALAGTASAGGWRSLRIDGSGEDTFAKSVDAFQEQLPAARQYVFVRALQDIWVMGAEDAEAAQREYTAEEYFRRLDGLGYKDIVGLSDPTGDTAKARFREAYARLNPPRATRSGFPQGSGGMTGFSGEQVRGIDSQAQAAQERLSTVGHLW